MRATESQRFVSSHSNTAVPNHPHRTSCPSVQIFFPTRKLRGGSQTPDHPLIEQDTSALPTTNSQSNGMPKPLCQICSICPFFILSLERLFYSPVSRSGCPLTSVGCPPHVCLIPHVTSELVKSYSIPSPATVQNLEDLSLIASDYPRYDYKGKEAPLAPASPRAAVGSRTQGRCWAEAKHLS
ncbi:hypothetical protein HYPSUDRAFT_776583 [Hypholoma sublateritium FD-334 SS-4]|uniref:Uncharacterized protein n=1 Tax=Hypholoma sublateritium (strain FD-334 SS-4) TaxID=945553 RepID=A0A0D2L286_HYPSF|nr:hypothetical protein HYPSUDRAFT_776583 [Hypholoma sublateritium FD-334 SS-4]